MNPSRTSTRPRMFSTRRHGDRFAVRSNTLAVAIFMMPSASRRDAPGSYIAARADAERQRWMKKAQVTAEKTAWLEVITHAQSHLTSAKIRARYDRTLAQEAEESFESLAEFAAQGIGPARSGNAIGLDRRSRCLGIASERADRLVGRICRRLNVARDRGTVDPADSASGVLLRRRWRRPMSMAQPSSACCGADTARA